MKTRRLLLSTLFAFIHLTPNSQARGDIFSVLNSLSCVFVLGSGSQSGSASAQAGGSGAVPTSFASVPLKSQGDESLGIYRMLRHAHELKTLDEANRRLVESYNNDWRPFHGGFSNFLTGRLRGMLIETQALSPVPKVNFNLDLRNPAVRVDSVGSTGLQKSLPQIDQVTERSLIPDTVTQLRWRMVPEKENVDSIRAVDVKIEFSGIREPEGVYDYPSPWRKQISLGRLSAEGAETFQFSLLGGRYLFVVNKNGYYRLLDLRTGQAAGAVDALSPFKEDRTVPYDLVLTQSPGQNFLLVNFLENNQARHISGNQNWRRPNNLLPQNSKQRPEQVQLGEVHQSLVVLNGNQLQFFSPQYRTQSISVTFPHAIRQVLSDFVVLENGQVFQYQSRTDRFEKMRDVQLTPTEILTLEYPAYPNRHLDLVAIQKDQVAGARRLLQIPN